MSYYKVKMAWWEENGLVEPVDIFDPTIKQLCLLNPVVTLDVGEAGNFEFIVPRFHVYYYNFEPYNCSIAVFEEEDCIFFGRLLPPTVDTYGNKHFHCEGAMAFLNDVILPPRDMDDPMDANMYVGSVINYYNNMQTRGDRELYFDSSIPDGIEIYDPDPWNYQSALSMIRDYLHQFFGGYFYTKFVNFEFIELKWTYDLTDTNSQIIEMGVNLLDLTQNGRTFYTAAIATGGTDADGNKIEMENPVQMSRYLINKYGFICAKLDYPDVNDAGALETYCSQRFLVKQQFNGFTFEAKAADRHPIDGAKQKYELGQQVRLLSGSLAIDATLPITRVVVNLNNANKEVTIGTLDKMSLTISTRKVKNETTTNKQKTEKVQNTVNKKSQSNTITGADGNDYAFDIDVSGGTSGEDPPTFVPVKVPRKIKFTRATLEYDVGDHLDYGNYTVKAEFGDGTEENVTMYCTFTVADQYEFTEPSDQFIFGATYKSGGVYYTTSCSIKVYPNATDMYLNTKCKWEDVLLSPPSYLDRIYNRWSTEGEKRSRSDEFNTVWNYAYDEGALTGNDILEMSFRCPPLSVLSTLRVYHKPAACSYVMLTKRQEISNEVSFIFKAFDSSGNELVIPMDVLNWISSSEKGHGTGTNNSIRIYKDGLKPYSYFNTYNVTPKDPA